MEKNQLRSLIEATLFLSSRPLTLNDLKKLVEPTKPKEEPSKDNVSVEIQIQEVTKELSEGVSKNEIKECLEEMQSEYAKDVHGIELVLVASGVQFRSKVHLADQLKNLCKLSPPKLSPSSMETLAMIAYQQPITRAKVEEIRGVDSGGVLKTLLERELLRIVGRSEEPGRPILYGTSQRFLETFSLGALSELPTLKDLESLDPSGTLRVGETVRDFIPMEAPPEIIFDDSSKELIEELESSMHHLRDVEKDIFPQQQETPEGSGEDQI